MTKLLSSILVTIATVSSISFADTVPAKSLVVADVCEAQAVKAVSAILKLNDVNPSNLMVVKTEFSIEGVRDYLVRVMLPTGYAPPFMVTIDGSVRCQILGLIEQQE